MFQAKKILMSFLGLCLLSVSAFALEEAAPAAVVDGGKVVFKNTGFDAERAAYLDINPDVKEAIATGATKADDIGIAIRDLNKDGQHEVLVYVQSSYFCGTLGCRFSINAFEDGQMDPLSEILTVQNNIMYGDGEHNGYQDIVLDSGNGKPVTWAYDSSMSKYNPVGKDGKGIDPSLQYQGNPVTGEKAPIITKPAGRKKQEGDSGSSDTDKDVKF